MAKKTARPAAKPTQQRTKEDQWRRRMAQQSQTGAGSVVAEPGEMGSPSETRSYEDGSSTAPARATSRVATTSAARRAATASSVAQRANMAANRSPRARLSATTLPIAEEMHYVRSDIRKLIILTTLCVAVIIALSFVVPSVIK